MRGYERCREVLHSNSIGMTFVGRVRLPWSRGPLFVGAAPSGASPHPLEELDRPLCRKRRRAAVADRELARRFVNQKPAVADRRFLQPIALLAGEAAEPGRVVS